LQALYRESRQCVICSTTTVFTCVNDKHYIDQPDLDGRPYELSLVALPYWIQACGTCKYRSRDIRDADPHTAALIRSAPYHALLTDSGYPYLAREYQAAAYVVRTQQLNADAAWYHLRAAWKCEDVAHPFANLCRKEALHDLEQAYTHAQPITASDAKTCLIIADVYRRNGDMANASHFHQRATTSDNGRFDTALALQLRLITTNNTRRHQRPE